MAANKVVPGMKDFIWSKPNTKGTKMQQLYLLKKGWAKKFQKNKETEANV